MLSTGCGYGQPEPEHSGAAYRPLIVVWLRTFPFALIVQVTGPLSPPPLRWVISTSDGRDFFAVNSRCQGSGMPLRWMIVPSSSVYDTLPTLFAPLATTS